MANGPANNTCPVCGRKVGFPNVDGLAPDLGFQLLHVALAWHLDHDCEEAYNARAPSAADAAGLFKPKK